MREPPLTALLSQVWVALVMSIDNAVEARSDGRRFRISFAMWANGLRCLDEDGTTVGDLTARARAQCNVPGLERWGYLDLEHAGSGRRPGHGSRRGITDATVVRPTGAGRLARRIWPETVTRVGRLWRARFDALDHLDGALPDRPDLPWAPPEVHPTDGFRTHVVDGPSDGSTDVPLVVRLGRALTARTLDHERDAPVSLPIAADVLRVVDHDSVAVRDLPLRSGVSKEAVAMAVRGLERGGLLTSANRSVTLTALGRDALEAYRRHPDPNDPPLREALSSVLADTGALVSALTPPDGGWRAQPPYTRRTARLLADPRESLPWQPMVLHRGGWPDGS